MNTFLNGDEPRYRITGPAVIANTTDGPKYVYRGDLLPANTAPWHVEHLLECDLIEPIGDAA